MLTTETTSRDPRLHTIDLALKRYHYQQDALIEILHKAQASFGYLEADVLLYIARQLKLPPSKVYGTATFYHLFTLKPSGVHRCVVCLGTACYVKGSQHIVDTLETKLRIKMGETTADGQISLLEARCVGACGIAPVVVLDDRVVGHQTPATAMIEVKHWEMEESSTVDR
jgi:bidirectional [NiFe] hydrogenase diaphorase subunit